MILCVSCFITSLLHIVHLCFTCSITALFLCCNVTLIVIKGAFQTKCIIRWLIPHPVISLLIADTVNVIHIFKNGSVAFLFVYELEIPSVPTCRSLQWPVKNCSLFLNSSTSQFFCCFIRQRNQFLHSDRSLSESTFSQLLDVSELHGSAPRAGSLNSRKRNSLSDFMCLHIQ